MDKWSIRRWRRPSIDGEALGFRRIKGENALLQSKNSGNVAQATRVKPKQPPLTPRMIRMLREAALFVLGALALYLLISLWTYHPADPSWSQSSVVKTIHNLGGKFGALMADLLFSMLGYLAYLFPLALAFAASLFSSVYMVTSMTVMQLAVPDHIRGRVMGIHTIGFSLIPLGGLFLGTLAETSNASLSVVIGNGIYLVFLLFMVGQPSVRRIDGRRLT